MKKIVFLFLLASCQLSEPIYPDNSPGFVDYQITGERIGIVIYSEEPTTTIRLTLDGKFREWVIRSEYYGCISFEYSGEIEIFNDSQYFRIL